MTKKFILLVALLLILPLALAACGGETVVEVTRVVTETITEVVEVEGTPQVVEVEVTREVTEVVTEVVTEEVIVEATPVPSSRTGGWLDTIIFIEEPNADAAVARLAAGDIDMYADDIGGQAAIEARNTEGVTTVTQYGLFDEIFFNNGTCADENLLNPFQNRAIREAMNWAIDRTYIADELYNGLAVPKYTVILEAGADRGRYAAEIRAMEALYAYDFDRAQEIITTEMEGMGATLEGGVWTYAGEPVTIIALIRNEDTRLLIGNYVSNQLEDMGFTVERVERRSSELSPIWASGDPLLCEWNFYTGAWSQQVIAREGDFEQYYFPRGYPVPSWQVIEADEAWSDLGLRLRNNDFANLEERAELFREALPISMYQSPRVWTTSRTTLVPFSDQVSVSSDLAAGISGSALWARTARFANQEGGSMTIGLPSVFTEPWNPVGGSNWVFDSMVKNAIGDKATYNDPNTGLAIPNRLERAEVTTIEGFPMAVSSDWVDLSFASEIVVPDDAWVDWDAANQVFLTSAEVNAEPQTAQLKSTVYYEADLFDKATWHDGSPMSPADFVMGMIMTFDQAKEDSPYYDEAAVPGFEQFMSAFKGTRIVSADPLVIEYYSDGPALDAENSITTWWPNNNSAYAYGDAAWHNMAVMLRAEAAGSIVFTDEKANALEVERINMIAGPSLEILGAELAGASEEGFIPFAATLGQYITADDAAARYTNLTEFARRYGHYYIGTGPYVLQGVFPVEGQAILAHFDAYPDPANKFANFSAPALATVEVDGDSRVTIGDEAAFDVYVDYYAGPYAVADISSVAYLLFDATGTQVSAGNAEAVEDGLWQITLSGDVTGSLVEGSNRLEIIVVSNLVALPGLGQYEFVTAP